MKKTTSLLFGFSLLLSELSAMDNLQHNVHERQNGRIETYIVQTEPIVKIEKSIEEGKIAVDNFIRCSELTLNARTYNGIPMLNPLKINVDMSTEQLIDALKTAFGADVKFFS